MSNFVKNSKRARFSRLSIGKKNVNYSILQESNVIDEDMPFDVKKDLSINKKPSAVSVNDIESVEPNNQQASRFLDYHTKKINQKLDTQQR